MSPSSLSSYNHYHMNHHVIIVILRYSLSHCYAYRHHHHHHLHHLHHRHHYLHHLRHVHNFHHLHHLHPPTIHNDNQHWWYGIEPLLCKCWSSYPAKVVPPPPPPPHLNHKGNNFIMIMIYHHDNSDFDGSSGHWRIFLLLFISLLQLVWPLWV